jgi:hypothetical protein
MRSAPASTIVGGWWRAIGSLLTGAAGAFAVVLAAVNSIAEERELPRIPFSDAVGAARLSELRFEYAMRGGRVSPGMVERGKEAAISSPLSTEPFLFAALLHFPKQESLGTVEAEPFLGEVLRRDPRSRGAHLLLLRRAVASKKIDAALFHLSRLKQLEPDMVGQLMRTVGEQIKSTEAADEVAEALSAHLELIDGIAEGVASGKASPEVVARFAGNLPLATLAKGAAAPVLMDRLIRDGYVSQARRLWGEVNGISPSEYSEPVYNSEFSRKDARAPFGWSYNENETGVSEWKGPGSVYVEYYGRRSGILLSQTLALLPGRYRAIAKASPQMPEVDSLALQVSCFGGAPVLSEAQMNGGGPQAPLEMEFNVPASCPGQIIAIVGLARERHVGGAITLHGLSVKRVAGVR